MTRPLGVRDIKKGFFLFSHLREEVVDAAVTIGRGAGAFVAPRTAIPKTRQRGLSTLTTVFFFPTLPDIPSALVTKSTWGRASGMHRHRIP